VSSPKDESSEEQEGAGDEQRDDDRLNEGKADKKCDGVGAAMIGAGMGTETLPAFN
jgi:hypothetical protein